MGMKGKTYPTTKKTYKKSSYKSEFAPNYQKANNAPLYKVMESKAYDNSSLSTQVNTSGSFIVLNTPVPGTDYINRIGRKVTVTSVFVRGFMNLEAAATPTTGIVSEAQMGRMIIFVDKQPNGATPATTDLLTNATAQSQLNLNNRDRFFILCDKQWVFDPMIYNTTATQAVATVGRTIVPIKKYKKVSVETIYNAGTAGTIADITTNAIHLFFIGTVAAGSDTDLNAFFSTRVRFIDA